MSTWQSRGLCGQMDRQIVDVVFFGKPNSRGAAFHYAEHVEAARNICGACPVRQRCLEEALAVPSRYDADGIRAGLLPGERDTLRGTSDPTRRWSGVTGKRARR